MAKQWNPMVDMPDLSGKVAVVTGASVGIGFETLRFLAAQGARAFCTTRSEAGVRQAKEKMRTLYPDVDSGYIEWCLLDLGSLQSIANFAEFVKSKTSKVDILINSAGIGTASTDLVADRWEQHMAINVAGPFYLTNLLLPLLETAARDEGSDMRIVNVSSIAPVTFLPADHQFPFTSSSLLADPVPSYPSSWRYMRYLFAFDMIRYCVSKAANTIVSRELQRRLDARGSRILSLSAHPGSVATEGIDKSNNMLIRVAARLTFMTAAQGAATPLFAATASNVRLNQDTFRGGFVVPGGKLASPHAVTEDREQVEELWRNMTEQLNEALVAEGLAPMQDW